MWVWVIGMHIGIVLLLLCLAGLAGGVAAAEPHALGTMVIGGTAVGDDWRLGDVDPAAQTGFSAIIERERFADRIMSLADVVQEESGVQIRQSGGLGAFASVSVRGASSQQVNVFLDGLPLNDANGGAVDLGRIGLADIGQIEIYRGITPIQLARPGLGGAVNIRTLRPDDDRVTRLQAGYGSFNTRRFNALHNQTLGATSVLANLGYRASDNNFRFDNDNGTPVNPYDDRREARRNAATEQWQGLFKLGRQLSPRQRVTGLVQLYSQDQGLPTWNNRPAKARLQTDNVSTQLRFEQLGIAGVDLAARGYVRRESEAYDDRAGEIGLGRQHTEYRTWRYGAETYAEWYLGRQLLTGIVQVQRETYDETKRIQQGPDQFRRRDSLALGLQWDWPVWSERLLLVPGLRWHGYRDGHDHGRAPRGYWDAQLGLRWRLLDSLQLKANLARYHREPSLAELYGDRGFILGNPDLQAERGLNADLGLVWRAGAAGGMGLKALRLAVFRNQVNDLILRVYDARGIGQAENIGNARSRGIELGLEAELPLAIQVRGNLTWLDTEDRSEFRAFNGNQLPGRFARSGFVRLQRAFADLTLFYEFHLEQAMYYDRTNLLPAANRSEHNAGLRFVRPRWRLGLEGRNLGNDNYEAFNGFPTPGRAVYATLGLSF